MDKKSACFAESARTSKTRSRITSSIFGLTPCFSMPAEKMFAFGKYFRAKASAICEWQEFPVHKKSKFFQLCLRFYFIIFKMSKAGEARCSIVQFRGNAFLWAGFKLFADFCCWLVNFVVKYW